MKIDVYSRAKNSNKHLSVTAGSNLSDIPFPPELDPDFSEVKTLRKAMEIDTDDDRIGINSANMIDQIKSRGFATHGTKITFTVD